jgi:hypothetical protein
MDARGAQDIHEWCSLLKKTYFLCNVAYQICLIDVAYLKHFFCLKWEKKKGGFLFS